MEIENQNLEFLHLVSSAILSGCLKNICFYSASFLSSKFVDISFLGCDLRNSDLCSIWANNCFFQDTDFGSATVSDSTFVNCTFDKTTFKTVSLTRCQFIDCTFEQLPIDGSTFSLNTFVRCNIKRTHFTESFYYQIFNNCTFYEVEMDPSLLGFNFGFSPTVLKQLATKNNLEKASNDFIEKKLYVNAAILHINQLQNYYGEAMVACITALGQMMQKNILIKADEIEFLKNLTSYFQEINQIAPISILRIWQLLNNEIMSMPENISVNKAIPLIRDYANKLYFDFINFQKKLQQFLQQLPVVVDIGETAELKVVYSEAPYSPLLNFLIKFSDLIKPNCPLPRLIRTEKGSFHEYHEIAMAILPYLQTFFGLLGVVVPIIITKKQKAGKQESIPANISQKEEMEITINTEKENKSSILLPDTNIISSDTENITKDVIKILVSQPVENHIGFSGYNNHNIRSITINLH